MPASKDTRVRVEDFSKIIARLFPWSAARKLAGSFLTRPARSRIAPISAGFQSFSLT
jgi:hypothetical protein